MVMRCLAFVLLVWPAQADTTTTTVLVFPNERKMKMPWMRCEGTETRYVECTGETVSCEECAGNEIHCLLGEWTDWSACLCDGLRERSRRVLQSNNPCGRPCDGDLVETRRCPWEEIDCLKKPVDCTWVTLVGGVEIHYNGTQDEGWSAWTPCDGEATQSYRWRNVNYSVHGGKGCDGPVNQTRACPVDKERPQDQNCSWSQWSAWGACTCPCDGGQKTRYRHVQDAPRGRGEHCQQLSKAEIAPCQTQSCKHPCTKENAAWGDWGDWGVCSKSCETGKTWRNRSLIKPAKCGGKVPDGSSVEIQDCVTQTKCDSVDCEFNEWADWSDCSCTCEGIEHRFRTIKAFGDKGGKHCRGPLKQVRECNQYTQSEKCQTPRQDCKQEWTEWSVCTRSCAGGQRFRNNTITQMPSRGGRECDKTIAEVQPCQTQPCPNQPIPIDCAMSDWTDWSACDKCSGAKRRNRHIIRMPKHNGKPCEDPAGPGSNNSTPWPAEEIDKCPYNCGGLEQCCRWTNWESAGTCVTVNAANCGPGFQKQVRKLTWGECEVTETTTTTMGTTTTVTTCVVAPPGLLFDTESMQVSPAQNAILSFALGSLITTIVSALVLRVLRRQRAGGPVVNAAE